MAWRPQCYECGPEAPITRPLYAKHSLLENGDLGLARANYESHPRRPTDTRSCSAVSTIRRQLSGRNVMGPRSGNVSADTTPAAEHPRRRHRLVPSLAT